MKKQFLALLLVLSLVVTLFPTTANAATSYNIWVGSTQVTSDNAANILSDNTASYNSSNNTLTLNNAYINSWDTKTVQNDDGFGSESYGYGIYSEYPLNIILEGNNTVDISSASASYLYGVKSKVSITIGGSGSLTVTVPAANWDNSYGICSDGPVTINSGTIKATSSGRAIFGSSININAGTIEATGTYGAFNQVPSLDGYTANKSIMVGDSSPGTVWDNSIALTSYDYVKIAPVMNYTATVTVNKDGSAWTSSTPDIKLSTSSDTLTGAISGTLSNGVYTFSGLEPSTTYYVWEDGTTDTYSGQIVTESSASATVNYYTVNFCNDTGSSTLNTQIVLSGQDAVYGGTMPEKTSTAQYSYTFANKWVTEAGGLTETGLSNITSAKTVYASFTQTTRSYTITWKKDSSTLIDNITVAYGIMPTHGTPVNAGYTFGVWTPAITNVTGDATYTANWTADSYSITYQLNGGNVSSANPASYTIESTAITLSNPTRDGYSFVGWTGSNGTTAQTSVAITPGSTGTKEYFANWKANTPPAPEASIVTARTDKSITINTQAGYEYRVDGTNWHSGTGSYTFTDLTAGTSYNLVCRKAEVTTIGSASAASDASEALLVTTKNSAPATPTAAISSFTTNKITMNEVTGGAYSKDGGVTWQDSNEFTGLTPATKYTFAVRINETETTMASATSATVDQYTVPSTPLAGEGYTIDYSAETIAITSGYEVSTTSDFSTVLTSGGAVVPGTTYYIRKAINNLTTPATPASDYIGFTTPLRPAIPTAAAVNETVSSKNDGKITDVTTAMEWKITGGAYAVVGADQVSNGITDLVDDIYYVRVKAVDNISFASAAQEIIISTGYLITVTFDSKSGSDVSQITGKSYGEKITEIVNDPTLSGYNFAGWYKEADCTNAWTFTIDTLTDNITLYAKWSAVPTYTVTGTIVDDVSPAAIVIDANVKLMKGTTQFGTTGMTDANGDFFINNVPSGTYNLVITKGTKTATILVQVSGGNVAVGNAVLPSGNANSILVINGNGTPDIVVGGLNTEANSQLGANTSVVITMMVEEKEASAAANGTEVSAAITSAGKQVGMILDIILSSSVNGGITTTVAETSNLIEIIVPIPTELQNKATYGVYRYHGTGTDVISETENADHEKIIVDRTNWTITLYVKKFSTYAIGYVNPASGGGGGSSSSGQNITAPVGLPYYIDANGNELFVGFSSDESGTMKYIVPTNAKVLFKENTKSFTDNTITWAKASIDFVTEREIFLGTSQDLFSLNESMTRAMFVTVIGRLYERSYGSVSGTSTFSDVNADAYYAKYVAWANEKGIIKGIGENLFAPDEKVTREQMAVIMLNFATHLKKAEATSGSLAYADSASISSWAMDGAKYCQETKVITGREGGSFAPQESATRAEVAVVINRFIKIIVE